MNTGVFICVLLGGLFAIFATLFALLKEKGAMLISGFIFLPKEERDKYDQARLCRNRRNAFFVWAVIFGIGAIASFFLTQYAAAVAFIVWLILFFKDFHLDSAKAFQKFKL
jgi:hypothetical protein